MASRHRHLPSLLLLSFSPYRPVDLLQPHILKSLSCVERQYMPTQIAA